MKRSDLGLFQSPSHDGLSPVVQSLYRSLPVSGPNGTIFGSERYRIRERSLPKFFIPVFSQLSGKTFSIALFQKP
jgi:hypothetical protein